MDVSAELQTLGQSFERLADPVAAQDMTRYTRDQFDYFGLRSPERRSAQKPTLLAMNAAQAEDLIAFADLCWGKPQREFQYAAVDVLRKYQTRLSSGAMPAIRRWITTKSWWDTIDFLSPHIVGSLVRRNPELVTTMDAWIADENIWLARSAILHQLMYKDEIDAQRLFSYCDLRASDEEFFIRKALGWALRQHGRRDPDAVRDYVTANDTKLSNLTKREALKRLT